jgi:Mrp family chromosome partitioning ATPase
MNQGEGSPSMLRKRETKQGLIRSFDPDDALAHAYHRLFQQLCQELPDPQRRFCAIVSAGPQEDRSTVAINLASVAARATQAPVLLIDADTATPSLHQRFDLSATPGLSELVAGSVECDAAFRKVGDQGVSILTCGGAPLSAVSLAESAGVLALLDQLRTRFGWIFADTAPLLTTPGPALFSRRADGVLLAVRCSSTRAPLVTKAVEKLNEAHANTLGVILTQRRFVIPRYVYKRL